MGSAELIKVVNEAGCELLVEGSYIRVTNVKQLSPSLKEKIREYRESILEILKRDTEAKQAGFIIGVTGQLYTCSLSRESIVYVEQVGDKWEAWRETYRRGADKAISIKVICNASTFKYAVLKARDYLDYIAERRRRQ